VTITISAETPIGGEEDSATCPAKVTLSFVPSNKDETTMGAHAAMWARCTSLEFSSIDAAGLFDGYTFDLHQGQWNYGGTFDGTTATLAGGPQGFTFVFPVGP
jgi:hypothetical protein